MNPLLFQLLPLAILVLSITSVVTLLAIAVKRHHNLVGTIAVVGLNIAFILCLLPLLLYWMGTSGDPQLIERANGIIDALFVPLQPIIQSPLLLNMYFFDRHSQFYSGVILLSALACFTMAHAYIDSYKNNREEIYVLMLIAVMGGILLTAAHHMAAFFISLELISISVIGMAAYTHERSKALEAAVKYLIISAVASATILLGMAYLYAQVGSLDFFEIGREIHNNPHNAWLVLGATAIVMGLMLKLAAVPFHTWAADVYQGAPSPVTTFLSTVSKIAALAVLMRFFFVSASFQLLGMMQILYGMAIASIVIGNLLAVRQVNLKRILAYSSIAHMGYILVALVSGGLKAEPVIAIYMATYVLTTIGAFGVVTLMSSPYDGDEAETLADFRGMFWRHPVLSAVLTVMMLSLAGIPLTAGFIGKFVVVAAAVVAKEWLLAGVVVLGSVIGLYYYLRVLTVLFMTPPDLPRIDAQPNWGYRVGGIVVIFISLLVLLWGIYPEPLIKLCNVIAVQFTAT